LSFSPVKRARVKHHGRFLSLNALRTRPSTLTLWAFALMTQRQIVSGQPRPVNSALSQVIQPSLAFRWPLPSMLQTLITGSGRARAFESGMSPHNNTMCTRLEGLPSLSRSWLRNNLWILLHTHELLCPIYLERHMRTVQVTMVIGAPISYIRKNAQGIWFLPLKDLWLEAYKLQ
jgi:hypothetical protein